MREIETDLTLPGLVHDLNNVFQTLVEAADLLSSDPRWASLSAAILRSVERGKNVTQSLQSAEQSTARLESILDNAISFVEDSTLGHGPQIQFHRRIDPGIELPRNWAWERVFINLFSNSVRAMPAGGAIYFTAARRPREIEIVVADEGPGIPPAILRHIFDPHVSTHGSGLGLHIVQTIVKQDGGHVRAANRVGSSGAEITIILPLEASESARIAHA